MKFSVVTVCYNAAETIGHCLDSVASQDYPDLEHVVIDGGSTDGTLDLIETCQGRLSQFVSEPDNGIYHAMNKGLAMATGEVVGFLNADDFLAHDAVISTIANAMEKHHSDAVYGDLDYVDAADMNRVVRRWKPGTYRPGAFRKGWVPPHLTFYCRKAVYDRLGGYREDFMVAADFELMLRFIEKHHIPVHYLPEVLVNMRAGGTADCLKGRWRGNREILKSFGINGLRLSPLFFLYKPIAKLSQLRIAGRYH